jgi:hypothetical protein
MNEYKLSTETIQSIKNLLIDEFNYDWDGQTQLIMLNETDAFVYLGILPDLINTETNEIISYLNGLHFDILTIKQIIIPNDILSHNPINPKHKFA